VIYQVYIRSFADGNGDGVGDLLGIRTRLPYLRALGVDAVWITPFYASPMADGGYDVTEHREVDPLFGTLGDAEALIAEAHRLGIRIIVDIVPNHTSCQAPLVPRGARRRSRRSGARALHLPHRPRRARRTAAERLGVGLRRPRLDPADRRLRRGRAVRGAPRRLSGTCTCSTPRSRTSTGATPRCAPSTSRSCASGWTGAWTASGSTWRTG
jgi:hypothetical protein